MKKIHGFTLIELMMTLVVAVIIVTVAVPGFRSFIQNNRATTQANELLATFTLARSEAIKRGIPTSICSSTNQATCAASTNWATGWILFVDINSDGAFSDDGDANLCEVDAAKLPTEDCLVQVWGPLNGSPTLTQTAGGTNVRYLGNGLARAAAAFTLTMPDCTGNQVRTININSTGRAAVSSSACP